jgi:hypothetical protein
MHHAAPDLLEDIQKRFALFLPRDLVHLLGFSRLLSTATPPRPALLGCAAAERRSTVMWEDPRSGRGSSLLHCRRPPPSAARDVRPRRPLCSVVWCGIWNRTRSLARCIWTPRATVLYPLGCSSEHIKDDAAIDRGGVGTIYMHPVLDKVYLGSHQMFDANYEYYNK